MRKFGTRARGWLERIFPERQIYHRSGGAIRYVSISPSRQIIVFLLTALGLGFMSFATIRYLSQSQLGTEYENVLRKYVLLEHVSLSQTPACRVQQAICSVGCTDRTFAKFLKNCGLGVKVPENRISTAEKPAGAEQQVAAAEGTKPTAKPIEFVEKMQNWASRAQFHADFQSVRMALTDLGRFLTGRSDFEIDDDDIVLLLFGLALAAIWFITKHTMMLIYRMMSGR